MHTFTLQIEFSPETLANAENVLFHHGAEAKRHYLENKITGALEGANFQSVKVELIQTLCIFCNEPAVTDGHDGADGDYGDRKGPKCQRHARPAGQKRF